MKKARRKIDAALKAKIALAACSPGFSISLNPWLEPVIV
jgi:hypothetical protein